MALEQKLTLKLQQRLVMTPALQMAIRLLQLNKLELEDVLQQEMVENPMLEEREDPDEDTTAEPEAGAAEAADSDEGEGDALPEEVDSFDEINLEAYFQDYYDVPPGAPSMREKRDEILLENTLAARPTMEAQLSSQLEMMDISASQMEIGRAIIGNLDAEGYLHASLEELAAMGPWSLDDVGAGLAEVQRLDPPGVAARDLGECLMLQLRHLGSSIKA